MTSWVRLWHDMPTDPKFRTIARAAKQPVPVVVAVFTFMLTDASANADERGRTTATDEDIASAFDLDEDQVTAIRAAMQGRVLDGDRLAGWEGRQPKKEDGSADRAAAWRAKKQSENAGEREQTLPNAGERPDAEAYTDTEPETEKTPAPVSVAEAQGARDLFDDVWEVFPQNPTSIRAEARKRFDGLKAKDQATLHEAAHRYARWFAEDCDSRKRTVDAGLRYVPHLATWIETGAWKQADALPIKSETQQPSVPVTKLDRERDRDLWMACEKVMGKPAPTSGFEWWFRNDVIEQAKQAA